MGLTAASPFSRVSMAVVTIAPGTSIEMSLDAARMSAYAT
jgi:hypothetical protein